ncbi:MAG: PQQ-binding-like beta-propeller repeat protein [Pirellulales bacterium]|nr:PQQ-binding-like beta-propeller repeat protein [Pirellulales bacterium]
MSVSSTWQRTAAAVTFAATAALGFAAEPAEAPAKAWPMFRGTVEGTGRSAAVLSLPLAPRWQKKVSEIGYDATPVIAEGVIYLGDLDGSFSAISLADGSPLWTITGSLGYTAAAAACGDVVVVGDIDGVVRGLAAADGTALWTHESAGEISGGPTVLEAEGDLPLRVLVGSQDATLACLAVADGRLLWSHTIADQIRCSPTVADDRVFLAGCDGKLHVISTSDGTALGEVAIDGPTGTTPAAFESRVYFGTEGGTFFSIDVAEPAVDWQMRPAAGGQAYRSSAAIGTTAMGPLAIVGSRSRVVEAFRLADGSHSWRQRMRGRVDSSPVVLQAAIGAESPAEVAVIGDAAGRIAALRSSDGEIVWEFDAGSGFVASPAVADGCLVMATDDGTLWCFAAQAGTP